MAPLKKIPQLTYRIIDLPGSSQIPLHFFLFILLVRNKQMKRRTFTKSSLLTAAGAALLPSSCEQSNMNRTNWAGNLTYSTNKGATPKDLAELTTVIRKRKKMKVLGTCHSFNKIADSRHYQVSLQGWQNEPVLDRDAMTVCVDANIRYGELAIWLQERGYAIHNLASLSHISIAGACATATHGSGDGNGNLATAVVGFDMMKADGSIVEFNRNRDADAFNSALVGLGALGVVTEMTLEVQPTFDVRQDLFQSLPLESLQKNFDAITSVGYSVSFFTDTNPIPSTKFGLKANSKARTYLKPRMNSLVRLLPEKNYIPSLTFPLSIALSNWESQDPGTSAYLILNWNLRPAAAKNCNRNTSFHDHMR